jgi:hypothetical protein
LPRSMLTAWTSREVAIVVSNTAFTTATTRISNVVVRVCCGGWFACRRVRRSVCVIRADVGRQPSTNQRSRRLPHPHR